MKKKKARTKAKPKAAKKSKARKTAKSKAKVKKSVPQRAGSKPAAKKAGKKARAAVKPNPRLGIIPPVNGVLLGIVDDYFAKIGVIALALKAPVAVGQRIQVLGHTTNFEEAVDSMQIDHVPVAQAAANDSVGIKVIGRARRRDHVYLLK